MLNKDEFLLVLVAMATLIGQTYGREGRQAMNPSGGRAGISLSQVIASVLEHNALAELESLVGLDLKTSETGKSNAMGKMR